MKSTYLDSDGRVNRAQERFLRIGSTFPDALYSSQEYEEDVFYEAAR